MWQESEEITTQGADLMTEQILVALSYILIVIFFPISIFFCVEVINEYQRAIVFRLGRVKPGSLAGPGLIFYLSCIESVQPVDLRIHLLNIAPQVVLTKDSVTVSVDAVVYYFIFNPLYSVIKVHDVSYSTEMLCATILRNVLGTKDLKEILIQRKKISDAIQKLLDVGTDPWGVKVTAVGLQEIRLPLQMQRAMAAEAEASQEAKAKVIAAQGELDASRTLKDACDIMTQGSAALQIAKEYERVVILRLGHLIPIVRGPGIVFILPCSDNYFLVDMRVVTYEVPPQEILTKDSVTIRVDAVVYFKVVEPVQACLNVRNHSKATNIVSATTLRNELGTKSLAELLSDRESISMSMQKILDDNTEFWGVKVERVEIKDVALPHTMQRAMAAEGEAAREAKAKVIAAQGELDASRTLKEASDIISSNPAALQLRYLHTLNTISVEQNKTIVFPLPMDILKMFLKK